MSHASVGKPLGRSTSFDEEGNEVPTGEIGTVFFGGRRIEYHNDPRRPPRRAARRVTQPR
jgi:hypothetical protein